MHALAVPRAPLAACHRQVDARFVHKLQPLRDMPGSVSPVLMACLTYLRSVAFGGLYGLFYFAAGSGVAAPDIFDDILLGHSVFQKYSLH